MKLDEKPLTAEQIREMFEQTLKPFGPLSQGVTAGHVMALQMNTLRVACEATLNTIRILELLSKDRPNGHVKDVNATGS